MADKPTEAQLARLPKAVRDRLQWLESEIRRLTDRLGEGPRDARVFADPYAEAPRRIDDRRPVRFQTTADLNDWIDVLLNPRGFVEIHANGDLAFTPRSGNGAHLRVVHHSVLEKLDREGREDAKARLDAAGTTDG